MINKMRKHIASELAIEHTKEIVNREGWSDKASFKKLDFKKRLEGKVFVEYMGEKVKRFKKKRERDCFGCTEPRCELNTPVHPTYKVPAVLSPPPFIIQESLL